MAALHELPRHVRLFLNVYPWRRLDPVPWTPLAKPLDRCRVAIVSSGGFTLPGQAPFDRKMRGGDSTFRVVPVDVEVRELEEHHHSWAFDHAGVRADANLGFPLDRLRELAAAGDIGEVAPRHLSCMGSLTSTGRLVRETAPAAVQTLVDDRVDVALLVPV